MHRIPEHPFDRKKFETTIRVIDVVMYGLLVLSGVAAVLLVPTEILDSLRDYQFLLITWDALLFLGGLAGLAGRLFRYWAVEMPGVAAGVFGCAIWLVVIIAHSFHYPEYLLLSFMIALTTASFIRRWVELSIFTSDPQHSTIRGRLHEIFTRRTPDAVAPH